MVLDALGGTRAGMESESESSFLGGAFGAGFDAGFEDDAAVDLEVEGAGFLEMGTKGGGPSSLSEESLLAAAAGFFGGGLAEDDAPLGFELVFDELTRGGMPSLSSDESASFFAFLAFFFLAFLV